MLKTPALYAGLTAVILSAVAVVTTTFGLFNSVLKDLMPHVEGATRIVNVASFGALVLLLALTLLIRKRLPTTSQYAWAGVGLVCWGAAVATYFTFDDLERAYVYRYPPASVSGAERRPQVGGPYHDKGKERAAGMDVATAVHTFGGPEIVNEHQLLWWEKSRADVVGSFVRYYAAIAFLMTAALFVVAIAVWRTVQEGVGSAGRSRRIPKKQEPEG